MTNVAVFLSRLTYGISVPYLQAQRKIIKATQRNEEQAVLETKDIKATRQQVYKALHEVYDPELGVNIIDLGLVYDVAITPEGFVTLTMTLTTQGCPMHESIAKGVGVALSDVPGLTGGKIQLVWSPPWNPDMMTPEGRKLLGF